MTSYITTPKDQTSALESYFYPESISGAICKGLPSMVYANFLSPSILENP